MAVRLRLGAPLCPGICGRCFGNALGTRGGRRGGRAGPRVRFHDGHQVVRV